VAGLMLQLTIIKQPNPVNTRKGPDYNPGWASGSCRAEICRNVR